MTARKVASLKPPASGQVDYWAEDLPGFGLRLSAGGRAAWCVMYRLGRRKVRLTLGTFPAMPLAQAREEAKTALARVQSGGDPAAERRARRDADTFGQLADAYLERYAKKKKRSWKTDDEVLKRDVLPKWRNRRAQEITRRDVRDLVQEIVDRGSPIMANRTFEILRRIFRWAIAEDYLTDSPCKGLSKPATETRRDRVLSADEIKAVWSAMEAEKPLVTGIFKLRLITAQRGGEIMSMRWQDIDDASGWWTIPAEKAKNGLSHRVPLSSLALNLIKALKPETPGSKPAGSKPETPGSEWVFPSQRKGRHLEQMVQAAYRIRDRAKVDFVPHDLRRTAASLMTGMGISRLTVAKILNHVERGVTATYDRHSYDAEKRAALDAWARRLEEIIAGKPSSDNVTELRRA
jgi:integrase